MHLLSTHGLVLALLCDNDLAPLTMREIAWQLDMTERNVQRIIAELNAVGVVHRQRVGRTNLYTVDQHHLIAGPLRHIMTYVALLAAGNTSGHREARPDDESHTGQGATREIVQSCRPDRSEENWW